mmetsp:Transcript_29423/g.67763  ORF Transcript_29423/g.67763 Transcript_29423/m.67763 type:complete len:710 (-) Transcript_29423:133-2262(-)
MVLYYSSRRAMWKTFISLSSQSSLWLGMGTIEFWLIMGVHVGLIYAMRLPEFAERVGDWNFDWTQLGASQFFLNFFITFYNGHCYGRFLRLYNMSMEVIDDCTLLAQELVVAMPAKELLGHRAQIMKYILASVHIFFFHLAGGPSRQHWKEVIRKGLLTQDELLMLLDYAPGHFAIVHVLTVWAMQVVQLGLRDPTNWTSRSQRIAHVYNRMDNHVVALLQAMEDLIEIIALPIPYPYYHMMNIIVLMNCMIFAVAAAVNFKTYLTAIPISFIIIFMLSIRSVAVASATPFGYEEDICFPISKFCQYTFDACTCLVGAFTPAEASNIETLVESTAMLSSKQILSKIGPDVIYRPAYDALSSSQVYWSREMPLAMMMVTTKSPTEELEKVVRTPEPVAENHHKKKQQQHHHHHHHHQHQHHNHHHHHHHHRNRRSSVASISSDLVSIPEEELFRQNDTVALALKRKEDERQQWIAELREEIKQEQRGNELLAKEAEQLRIRLEYSEKHCADLEAQGAKLPPESERRMFRSTVQALEFDNPMLKMPSHKRRGSLLSGGVVDEEEEEADGNAQKSNAFTDFEDALERVQVLVETADEDFLEKMEPQASKMSKQKSDKKGASKTGLRPAKRRSPEAYLPPTADELMREKPKRVPAGNEHKAAKVPISGKVSLPVSRSLVSLTDSTKTPSEGDVTVVLREVDGDLERPGDYWLV